jgi:hypothetical protein
VTFKIGEFFFNFVEEPNISLLDWNDYKTQHGEDHHH